jgi:hypothetical protein
MDGGEKAEMKQSKMMAKDKNQKARVNLFICISIFAALVVRCLDYR